MNYNTDPQLYKNLKESVLKLDPCLRNGITVIDGHIVFKRGAIGRFTSNQDAEAALREAGWHRGADKVWHVEGVDPMAIHDYAANASQNVHNLTRAATYYASKGHHLGMVRALLLEYDGCILEEQPADQFYKNLDALWEQWTNEADVAEDCILFDDEPTFDLEGNYLRTA
jgi:hypothetical protein